MNIIFRSLFATLKYYYVQTEENQIEKNMVGYKFFYEKVYKLYKDHIVYLTKDFDYIFIISKFLNINTEKIKFIIRIIS